MYIGERSRQLWIYKMMKEFESILKIAPNTKKGIKMVERRIKRLQKDIKKDKNKLTEVE